MKLKRYEIGRGLSNAMADPSLLSAPPRAKSKDGAEAQFELVDSKGRKIPRKVFSLISKKMGEAPFTISKYNFNPENDPPNVHVSPRDYPKPRAVASRGSSETSGPSRGFPGQKDALDEGSEKSAEGPLARTEARKTMLKKRKDEDSRKEEEEKERDHLKHLPRYNSREMLEWLVFDKEFAQKCGKDPAEGAE